MGDVQLIQWIDSHGLVLLIWFTVTNICVGYLPAPTKDSSPFYVWFFKVSNSLVFAFARAFRSRVENSPNFQDAVKIAMNGGSKTNDSQSAVNKP